MDAWIDADVKSPTENGHYLVVLERAATEELGGNSRRIRILRWTDECWQLPVHIPKWINDEIKETVTHWQSLPQMPDES